MSIIELYENGIWHLEWDIESHEFWPYTSLVQEVAFSAPRKFFKDIEHELYEKFKKDGFKIGPDNKSAFGVVDRFQKIWYLGFYDYRFSLGLSVRSLDHREPIRKEG